MNSKFSKFFPFVLVALFSGGIVFLIEENRITNIRIDNNIKTHRIEERYRSQIQELTYQIKTGDKRTPEERRQAERYRDFFDDFERPR